MRRTHSLVGAMVMVGAMSATPASAGGPRAVLDVTYTPAARKPVGFGLAVDVRSQPLVGRRSTGTSSRTQFVPGLYLGGGGRLQVFLDGTVQASLHPIVGTPILGHYDGCGIYLQDKLNVDLRPGLALRSRGGPALSLGGQIDGGSDTISGRMAIDSQVPLNRTPRRAARAPAGPVQGTSLTFGAGVRVGGTSLCVVGRPLRDADDDDTITLPDAPDDALPPLAARWLEQAREEHAAVAAFLRLAGELESIGAPDALVQAAHEAAHDEAIHAALCLGRAVAHAGRPLTLAPLCVPIRDLGDRASALATLARESWEDGAVNEGRAALDALVQAREAVDAADRSVHARIAVEEAHHARLGAAITRWCEAAYAA